jgi:hypothetical protein
MREAYLTYRDVIFVNRRMVKTRFGRSLLLFCIVNSDGQSVLVSFAMLTREDEDSYLFACKNFLQSVAHEQAPRLFVIERSQALRSALLKTFTGPAMAKQFTVLYCTEHYRRSLRHFFDQKDNCNKFFAGPAALMDTFCDIKNQAEFDQKLK